MYTVRSSGFEGKLFVAKALMFRKFRGSFGVVLDSPYLAFDLAAVAFDKVTIPQLPSRLQFLITLTYRIRLAHAGDL